MVTTPAQARLDINLDGTIGTADVSAVKARSGTAATN